MFSLKRILLFSIFVYLLVSLSWGQSEKAAIDLGDGVKMEFVLIRPGSFTMGSDPESGDGDEKPEHKVTLTGAYYLGKYEVTQEQWEKIMGGNPSHFKGAKLPVETVSWNDCQNFLMKLREKSGRSFLLPTEAQWEYACRAGTTSRWSFGTHEGLAGDYAWMGSNSGGTTHPVGEKKPNRWGLCDMHGNVGEWCADRYANPYPSVQEIDPLGPSTGDSRVSRGGAWGDHPDNFRSAYRNCVGPEVAHDGIGLRCVMVADETGH